MVNYEHYGSIVDDEHVTIPDNIENLIINRGLVSEAKAMLSQLEHVAAVLNMFQDNTKNLSDYVRGWLRLINDGNIKKDVRTAIDSRFRKMATVWHILAFMLDNRDCSDWPELPIDLADEARKAVLEMGEANIHAMAAFEIEDTSVFPKLAFTKTIKEKMEPGKYWSYVAN